MAATVTFTSNLPEVLDRLQSAKSKALAEVGIAVQGDAIDNSPVRTGALRGSWTVEVDEDNSCVKIGVPVGDLDRDYAKYVELGTSKQPAQHMLRNAVESNKGNFRGITETVFKNA